MKVKYQNTNGTCTRDLGCIKYFAKLYVFNRISVDLLVIYTMIQYVPVCKVGMLTLLFFCPSRLQS
jgi:hypothetical protein